VNSGDRVRWVGDGPDGPVGTLRCVQAPDMGGNHIWIVDVDGDRARSRKESELEPAGKDTEVDDDEPGPGAGAAPRPRGPGAAAVNENSALCPECYQPRGHCEHTEGQSMFDREVDILPDDDPDRALVLRLAREGRGLRQ
jgi:hypothetical protein